MRISWGGIAQHSEIFEKQSGRVGDTYVKIDFKSHSEHYEQYEPCEQYGPDELHEHQQDEGDNLIDDLQII